LKPTAPRGPTQPAPKPLLAQENAWASDAPNRLTRPAIASAAHAASAALAGGCLDDLQALRVFMIAFVFMLAFLFQ
jgi:hypothetical protein